MRETVKVYSAIDDMVYWCDVAEEVELEEGASWLHLKLADGLVNFAAIRHQDGMILTQEDWYGELVMPDQIASYDSWVDPRTTKRCIVANGLPRTSMFF